MANLVSPGINVSEFDLTTLVPTVSTTTGAFAGIFSWGPVGVRTLVSTEPALVKTFGVPTNNNYETFFTAANFLAYGNQLYVVRVTDGAYNAYAPYTAGQIPGAGGNTSSSGINVGNDDIYTTTFATSSNYANVAYIANFPGSLGNALTVSVCDSNAAYSQTISNVELNTVVSLANVTSVAIVSNPGNSVLTATVTGAPTISSAAGILAAANSIATSILTNGSYVVVGNTTVGTQTIQVANIVPSGTTSGNTTTGYTSTVVINLTNPVLTPVTVTQSTMVSYWQYYNQVSGAPGTSPYLSNLGLTGQDQMHVVVVDSTGLFSGTPGTALEVWPFLSRATDAKGPLGNSIYYKTVLNNQSVYLLTGNGDRAGAPSALSSAIVNSTNYAPLTIAFTGGVDGNSESNCSMTALTSGFNAYANKSDVQIDIVLSGKARGVSVETQGSPSTVGGTNYSTMANYILGNIVLARKDCVQTVSPAKWDVVLTPAGGTPPLTNVQAFFQNLNTVSNYMITDSGYKYQYDKYNDTYRWVPLNGDIGGVLVNNDITRAPWYSPAGFSRGQIKNVVKLAWNPNQAQRDILYTNYINPVVTFPGQGTVLFGDKTYQGTPSAFDRINVRRLFITLERAISIAAQSMLFEFNNAYTQTQFINLITPYLRTIQGAQGIQSFLVVCDSTNNTPAVIDANQFVGDIYIQPAKSINFIQLNFNAVRTGVAFSTIINSV